MPILKAKFEAAGCNLDVVSVHYSFAQPTDKKGIPAGEPAGGIISITLRYDSARKGNLTNWMLDPYDIQDGQIEYIGGVKDPTRLVRFTDAYCVGYEEHFEEQGRQDGNESSALQLTLKISPRTIEIDNMPYEFYIK